MTMLLLPLPLLLPGSVGHGRVVCSSDLWGRNKEIYRGKKMWLRSKANFLQKKSSKGWLPPTLT
jgi:hypothetical protein